MKKSMLTRIVVGIVLSVIFIGLWFAGGIENYGMAIYMCAFSFMNVLCVYEMIVTMRAAGYSPVITPVVVFASAMSFFMYYDKKLMFFAAYIAILATILMRIFNKNGRNEDMIVGLFIYLYPLAPLICLFKLCSPDSLNGMSRLAMFFAFACPLLGDTLAYFFGVSFGKRKLCEHISPKKTVAGSIGGLIGGGLGGLLSYYMQGVIQSMFGIEITTIGMLVLVLVGLALGLVGQVGDLFASCIKRWAGVKDYGKIFPGHGGMMDRLDSVMMCAPFVLWAFSMM